MNAFQIILVIVYAAITTGLWLELINDEPPETILAKVGCFLGSMLWPIAMLWAIVKSNIKDSNDIY